MVSVGQPLDVAVTLPQRCGVLVSEPCGSERASPSLLPLGLINLITALGPGQLLPLLTSSAHLHRSPGVNFGSEMSFPEAFKKVF